MRASDSSERYAGKVRECCNYAARSAKNFVKDNTHYKRQPCGEDEKKLASILKEDLTTFCDSISEDSFTASQKAYILSNLLVFIFMLLTSIFAILGYYVNELIIVAALVSSILALLGYFGAFGGTSKKATGSNIFAVRNCTGEVKNRIILEANLDAPFKRTISSRTARVLKALNLILILFEIAFCVVVLLITYGTLKFTAYDAFIYVSFALPLFSIVPIILTRSVITTASTPGVTDNLISCYTACGAVRYLSEMDLRLHHTELCVLLTGSRNAGMAGAKTYCKLHGETDRKIDTAVISLNSIYNADTMSLLSTNKKADALVRDAANIAGVSLISSNPKYIHSSSKIFKKAGIANVTLTSLTEDAPIFYGNANDNTENISVPAIEAAIKIILETAYLKDSK